MMRIARRWIAIVALTLPFCATAETESTLTLDELSFISFGDHATVALPAGSTVVFRFGPKAPDGSVPFTIRPRDVSIEDVSLPSGSVLRYALSSAAEGRMETTPEGRRIEFTAPVRATVVRNGRSGESFDYEIPFTTEKTTAANSRGTVTRGTFGMRLVEGVWYGQLVGSTTNHDNAFPEPGAAVYTVLSGRFDRVP